MADLKAIASQVRRDIVRMVHGASSGHPGGSLGCADFFTALYFKAMKHDPAFSMDGKNEDLFFLSNGHISPVFYSALARSGYFNIKELAVSGNSTPGCRAIRQPMNTCPVSESPAVPWVRE